MAARGAGSPVSFTASQTLEDDRLLVGEATDCKVYDTLIALPERAPKALLADKGYDSMPFVLTLQAATLSPLYRVVQTAGSNRI